MPWLNKRWISFFVFSAVAGVVLVSVVGWANNLESNKREDQLSQFSFSFFSLIVVLTDTLCKDSYGTDPNSDIVPPDFGTNWTDVNQALLSIVTVNSFDPLAKTGPAVSPTDCYSVYISDDNRFHEYSLAFRFPSVHS